MKLYLKLEHFLIKESVDQEEKLNYLIELYDLQEVKSVDDILSNIDLILKNERQRKVAAVTIFNYLNALGDFGKEFIKKYKINSSEDLNRWCDNRQSLVRKGAAVRKKEDQQEFQNTQDEMHLNNITKMALEQDAEMDRKIKERFKD